MAVGVTSPESLGNIIAPNWTNVAPEEMDYFLKELDAAMDRIANGAGMGKHLNKLLSAPLVEKDTNFIRGSMRTLLLAGNFLELSVEGQAHPGMQRRLKYSVPEIDSVFQEIIDKLKSLTSSDFEHIKETLNEDIELADRILEVLVLEAEAAGANRRRRRQLNSMGQRVIRRLKHSPELVINEYIRKCEKMAGKGDSEVEMSRLMAAYIGEEDSKVRIDDATNAQHRWQNMDIRDSPIGYQLLQNENENRLEKSRDPRYNKGLKLLGTGLIVTGAGLVLIGIGAGVGVDFLAGLGVVAGVTVGPIMILIALLILLVQLIIGPSNSKETTE